MLATAKTIPGSNGIGYFTEIEMLQNKIKQLEEKLQEEREEYKSIYAKMKVSLQDIMQENKNLKAENTRLVIQNGNLKQKAE
jgi:peptidoglycan hydrolase CwlO-like protein